MNDRGGTHRTGKNFHWWMIIFGLLLLLSAMNTVARADAPDVQYSMIELQDISVSSGYGAAMSINAQRVLVGRVGGYGDASSNVYVPAIWHPDPADPDTYIQTIPEGTARSAAQDVNYYGQYVGNIDGTAFYYDSGPGTLTMLTGYMVGTGGNYLNTGKVLNDNGQIALTGDDGHGYIFDLRENGGTGGITHDLGDLENGHLIAINTTGQVIGLKGDHYFFWDATGGRQPIVDVDNEEPVAAFEVTALNDGPAAVGWCRRHNGTEYYSSYFVWTPTEGFTYFDLPGDFISFKPWAINNQGWMVGEARHGSTSCVGLHYDGELYNLNDFMESGFGGNVKKAYDIDENGWIAAGGWSSGTASRAVLLKPTWSPPPPPPPFDGVQNPGFEAYNAPTGAFESWTVTQGVLEANPGATQPVYGDYCAGASGGNQVTFYQVLDLNGIEDWIVYPPEGGELLYDFIQFSISLQIANLGGTGVTVGLDYLPMSYNTTDYITGDDPAWQPRQWTPVFDDDPEVMAYTSFVNNGGDAVDLGDLIRDTAMSPPMWREVACNGWLPRVRWVRLRISIDSTAVGTVTTPAVAVDDVVFEAASNQYGPYSAFGTLPEAGYPEDPDAPDKAVPAWVGPEGDGISGGYTGMTLRNYPNPAFAGYADDYVDYDNSGQHVYMGYDEHPEAITGRPWNDAGWVEVIITLGDMSVDMLADYFSPSPTGDVHPGEITAVFNETPIVNGPGHDFATFENGFVLGWTTAEIFGELAYVEVSSNGTDFIRFPTHSLTPEWPGAYGCFIAQGVFGLTGKHVNAYGDAWGTPFDLDWIADHPLVLDGTVDLNDIRYVRQVDVPGGGPEDANGGITGFFHDSYGNIIFDSWLTWGSGGADLDAVGVLNTSATDPDGDNITDYWDNCPQTANANQYDTDGDGFGNMCDCDIDGEAGGDGTVNYTDYQVLRAAYGGFGPERIAGEPGQDDTYTDPSENWNADADFNGDNVVNYQDYQILRARYGSAAPFN